MTFSRFLRDALSEGNPVAAGMQVDFEQREADPSRYTIGHNIHPASEMEDQMGAGGDGMQAPYDGSMVPGGPGGAGMPPGGMPPGDQELQPIQPGMAPPPGQGMPPQQPPMQEGAMKDEFDLFLDEVLSEGPFDYQGPDPGGRNNYGNAVGSPNYPGYGNRYPATGGGYVPAGHAYANRPGYGAAGYPMAGQVAGDPMPRGYSTADLNNQEMSRVGAAAPAAGGGGGRGGGGRAAGGGR